MPEDNNNTIPRQYFSRGANHASRSAPWQALLTPAIFFLVVFAADAGAVVLNGSCSMASTQCELSTSYLQLCNHDGTTNTYRISMATDGGNGLFSVVPEEAFLRAGECTDVKVFSVSECYASPGKFTAKVVVEGDEEKITKDCTLIIEQGHSVGLQISPQEQNASQCEEKIYELLFTNISTIQNQKTENVKINVTGLPEGWYSLDRKSLSVEKGRPERVVLKVKAPCETSLGLHEFSVRASLVNPEFYSETNGTYVISQGQNVSVVLPTAAEAGGFRACQEEKSIAVLKVRNDGKNKDTFRLSLAGPEFASLQSESVTIAPGKEAGVQVNFSPTNEKAGDYPIVLRIEGTSFDYSTMRQTMVRLEDCYGVDVNKLEGADKSCAEEKPVYRFRVLNNRARPIELKPSMHGISARLDTAKISIQPGEEKRFGVELDISKVPDNNGIGGKGVARFTLRLEAEHFTYEKSFSIEVSDCGNASLDLSRLELCKAVQKEESVTIVNLGTQKQEFRLQYSPAWVTGPEKVEVASGSKEKLRLRAEAPEGATDENLVVKAVSEKAEAEAKAGITYLPNRTCFGIDVILPSAEIDSNSAIGKKFSIFVENNGKVTQEVSLSADRRYVKFADETVEVGVGSRKEVNFFVTPPFDLAKSESITITAETDRGYRASGSVNLTVSNKAGSEEPLEEDTVIEDANEGSYTDADYNAQVVVADNNKGAVEKAQWNVAARTGFFSLANVSTGLLAGLVVVVILLIAYSAYKSVEKEMHSAKQEQEAASKAHPETTQELGRKEIPRRGKRKSRGKKIISRRPKNYLSGH